MLEISGLTKRYGGVTALSDVSLHVERGEVLGFVGPNGAGKSTTMRIVLGVLAADAGRVGWDGRDVDAAARARMGYMPEERGLYPRMPADTQLAYLARLHGRSRQDAERAAKAWLDRLGLGDRAHEQVDKLSLGNQQRVQLAAALVHDPEVLVLDEPFSGLDPFGVDVMAGVLAERVAAGAACIFSSHQLELVERLCTSVCIIRAGTVVAFGPVAELRQERAGRRYRVGSLALSGRGGDAGAWLRSLPGARLVAEQDGMVTVDLADGVDEQAVLDLARAAGPVSHWSRVQPTLTELFRAAVAA